MAAAIDKRIMISGGFLSLRLIATCCTREPRN
jgi:hypothetical protein